MKKIILFMTAVVAVLALNGCGGSTDYRDDYVVDYDNYSTYNGNNLTTLFLVDDGGYSYARVPYKCDSMYEWSETAPNGEFSFIQHEYCEFDFIGWNGTDPDDGYKDNIIYIVDYNDNGKNNIPYECSNFNIGNTNYTYDDGINGGSFDYDIDDRCTFYL